MCLRKQTRPTEIDSPRPPPFPTSLAIQPCNTKRADAHDTHYKLGLSTPGRHVARWLEAEAEAPGYCLSSAIASLGVQSEPTRPG